MPQNTGVKPMYIDILQYIVTLKRRPKLEIHQDLER